MSTIRVNNVTDELGTGAPDFPNGITIDTVTVSGKIVHTGDTDTSIGFPINDTITMDTAGTERMRIDSSGNVGIGVTPTVPLHVVNASTPRIYLGSDASKYSGLVYTAGTTFGSVAIRGQGNDIGTVLHVDRDNSQVRFDTSGTERMRIDSSGNVGIGTTEPLRPLSVAASSAEAHIFAGRTATGGNLGNTAAGGRVSLGSTSAATGVGYEGARIGMVAAQAWTVGSAQGSSLVFENTANDTATLTERMRIDSTGYVGIGTTSPNVPLDVSSTGVGSTIVSRFYVTDNTVGLLRVGNSTTGDGATAPAFGSNATSAVIHTNNTERMRIDSSGNVGIGTSPAEQLHITGNFRVGSAVMATPTGSAPLYACRAWVNFNGTGTVAIRGGGNVSSITDNGNGLYRVNFTTALQDTNYAITIATNNDTDSSIRNTIVSIRPAIYSTTQVGVLMYDNGGGVNIDKLIVCVSVFR